jgi:hypothetical protein
MMNMNNFIIIIIMSLLTFPLLGHSPAGEILRAVELKTWYPRHKSLQSILGEITKVQKHIYHTLFIPKGEAEPSQIFQTPTLYQNDLAMRTTADVTGGKPIAD